jgi:tight adherence protein B
VLLVAASFAAALWLVRREASRRRTRARLETELEEDGSLAPERAPRRHDPRVPAWRAVAAALVVAAAAAAMRLDLALSTGIGAVAGVLVHVAAGALAQRRALRLEEGLAEVIGLASSALRAGASPVDALERAARAVHGPAQEILLDLAGRLRLGEDPESTLAALAERVPLESFRLFALAVAVQWRAGGSLDRSLAVVARAVRDRVELQRRIHTQGAPTRGSVFAFVVATAAIAFLMWQHDPANLERFLGSPAGSALVGVATWLQALGISWMWRITQIRV